MRNPQIQMTQVEPLDFRQDYASGSYPVYIGETDAGNYTGTGSALWRIRKIIYDGAKQIGIAWATGTGGTSTTAVAGKFNQTWDNRASYTYN